MFKIKESYTIEDLKEIMTLLRSERGCPWDQKQTHESIRMDLLEEAYEVMEAIDNKDSSLLKEELGDLLLQIVFHAEIEREISEFQFDDVCDMICKKLIYRHPHVFGDIVVSSSDEVLKNWDNLKSKSKDEETFTDRLVNVPKLLPALMRGDKVGKRAANIGFDFEKTEDVINKLNSEIEELKIAILHNNEAEIEDEFGDILFTCCNLGRFLKKDSEKALTSSINKFIMRFRAIEKFARNQGKKLDELSPNELDVLWENVKQSTDN